MGDCVEINDSTYSPKNESWPFINYLDTGSITENRISGIQHLIPGKDKIPSRARRKVRQGDMVYSTVRPNQRHFGLLKDAPPNFLASTGFAVIRGIEGIANTDFIYWFLSQERIVEYLHAIAEDSVTAYPSIKPNDIEQLTLNLPPLNEQRAIAHVLGTLDDKIELNRRMNETLEEMARAVFKDWFVDFGPTRAKMEGRERYLPVEVWKLFPDRMVGSEVGKIPEGWGVKMLGAIANQRRCGVKPEHIDPDTPYIGLEHMPKRCIALSKWDVSDGLASSKFRFERGDILFGKLRPYFHKVGLAPIDGICSTDIVTLSPKAHSWSHYVLLCTSSDEFVAYTDQTSTGTRMPRTSWKIMSQYELCLPPETIAATFQKMTQPLLERVVLNIHESHALSAQRDALLPKLVSGAICTP